MNYKAFLIPAINLLAAVSAQQAEACGPYDPGIPTVDFMWTDHPKPMSDYDREENLRLWQSMTSERIPLADIEQAVYKDSREDFYDRYSDKSLAGNNLFYTYLRNSSDWEVVDFLLTAKDIEEQRRRMESPWYYPQSRNQSCGTDDFESNIRDCNAHIGPRLRDRYALQVVRALFASHQYENCIEYFDSTFVSLPDSNLMKRMAQRYVAGCWSRLNETERADSLFAQSGDIWSLSVEDKVAYMATHNPNAPQIIEYIRSSKPDTDGMIHLLPIAKAMLRDKSIRHKGDWAFLLAYFYNEYTHDADIASRYISQALKSRFSTTELHDLARAYKMKIDAQAGDTRLLLSDLKWIEGKCDVLSSDADLWIRRVQNIIYSDWLPQLWEKKDYATSILMAAYADNLPSNEDISDYGSLSFQMMGSLTSGGLARTYDKMKSSGPLYSFLRKGMRSDSDYYNELIGTLALREENYRRAVAYLSKVSHEYQRTMNIFQGGYLRRDPFKPYPTRWYEVHYYNYWEDESSVSDHFTESAIDAKLVFARRMLTYQQQQLSAKSEDDRTMARLMYAIGRRNSFEECWALTQYWRGSYVGLFTPDVPDDITGQDRYSFLYDYERSVGHKCTEALYEKEISDAMSLLKTDEAKAKAEYLFDNLKTVVIKYPETTTAQFVKTSCDNWRDWK